MTQQERCRQSIVHCIYCARQHIKHTLHPPGGLAGHRSLVGTPLSNPFLTSSSFMPLPNLQNSRAVCDLWVVNFMAPLLRLWFLLLNMYEIRFRIIWQYGEFSSFYSSYSAQNKYRCIKFPERCVCRSLTIHTYIYLCYLKKKNPIDLAYFGLNTTKFCVLFTFGTYIFIFV